MVTVKGRTLGLSGKGTDTDMYEILPVKPIGPQLYEINRFKAMFQV